MTVSSGNKRIMAKARGLGRHRSSGFQLPCSLKLFRKLLRVCGRLTEIFLQGQSNPEPKKPAAMAPNVFTAKRVDLTHLGESKRGGFRVVAGPEFSHWLYRD